MVNDKRGFVLGLVLAGLLIGLSVQVASLRSVVADSLLVKEKVMAQSLTTRWRSGGIDRELVTYIEPNETTEAFAQRHAAAERAAFAIWPKDP